MKSILQEASSIERAIDKAWNEAGKPKEFTIKILDQGERNFLGLTRRPAIVSILYKPEKSTYHQPRPRRDRNSAASSRKNDRSRRNDNSSSRSRGDRSNNGYERTNREEVRAERPRQSVEAPKREEMNAWRDEWKQSVTNNLREMLRNMSIKTSFQTAITDDRVLTITFKSALLQDEEEQRMLFASLSYLSIQFLKREYKNRFTGFRIVVTGPAPKKREAAKEADASEKSEKAPRAEKKERTEKKATSSHAKKEDKARSPRGRRQKSAPLGVSDDTTHVDEQLKFAKQQLAEEGDLADVLEQVTADKSKDVAPAEKEAAPAKAENPATQKAKPAAKSEKAVKPLKKDAKYQPFFVLPEENESNDDA